MCSDLYAHGTAGVIMLSVGIDEAKRIQPRAHGVRFPQCLNYGVDCIS